MKQKILEVRSLDVSYNGYKALQDVNLDVYDHDFIGIIGPNGGGKTTLVKSILGLIKPSKGSIGYLFDQEKSPIGYLPQIHQFDFRFPMSVLEVVLSGMSNNRFFPNRIRKEHKEKAHSLLQEMGIVDLSRKPIGELSGGQMQRVFLCRAIISGPKLLILDEPNTFVDAKFEHDLYKNLVKLNQHMAILLVSHDVGTISYYIRSIACVNRKLHYHDSNKITNDQLASYDCPIQIITHGHVPHTVLKDHS
ncbi:MAG: ATP-binding cassette domain-containing protein [Bacteroidetes bacterium]|nr:ATP-binding cassette domain-containing protein [Bacteroidota bacterium]